MRLHARFPHPAFLVALLAVVALHGALIWIYYNPEPKQLWGDEALYYAEAQRILAGEAPVLEPLWPALYARFVALALFAGGGSLVLLQLVQTLALVGAALLLRDLWRHYVDEGTSGDWLALALTGYPSLAAYCHYLWPEILHLGLFLSALWILARRRYSSHWQLLLGGVLGAALGLKHLLGPFLPVLLLPLVGFRGNRGIRWNGWAMVLIGLATVQGPLVWHSWSQHGTLPSASSARFNLWVGLNDQSREHFTQEVVGREYQAYRRSAVDTPTRNAILTRKIRQHFEEHGVAAIVMGQLSRQYFRLFHRDSFLTDQLPGGVLHRRGSGYRDPSRPVAVVLRGVSYGAYAVLLVLAALGIAVCPPRGRGFIGLMLAFLAYNVALFFWVHVKTRYRIPCIPFLLVYAGLAWRRLDVLRVFSVSAMSPSEASQAAGLPRRAWAAGLTLAAVFLALAFG